MYLCTLPNRCRIHDLHLTPIETCGKRLDRKECGLVNPLGRQACISLRQLLTNPLTLLTMITSAAKFVMTNPPLAVVLRNWMPSFSVA